MTLSSQSLRRFVIGQLSLLYPYIKARKALYARGALYLLLTNAFALVIPWVMKLAVESLQFPERAAHTPRWYALAIVAAALCHGCIRILSRTAFLNSGRNIEFQLREDLYNRLISLDLPFFSRERTGDILSRFSNDLSNVRMLVGFGFLNVINTIILYTAALALMIRISPILTAASLVPYTLMVMSVKRLSLRMFERSTEVQEELSALSSKIEENVSAAILIRTYCREDAETAAFADICERYRRRSLDLATLRGIIIPIMGMASGAGTLIVLFFGGSRVISGALTLGDFVAFNGYLAMLIWPTVMMGWILNLMQRGAASMVRLNAILGAQPEVTEPTDPVVPAEVKGGLELQGLTFAYGDRTILDKINLSIPAGTKVGIAGEVGAGKSTLVRLVARLLPVTEGMIFLDGVDVNRIPLRDLRQNIGFVPQESFLFSRSIYENIAFGSDGVDAATIRQAAAMAQLDTEVERFPQKYETLVGERGLTLSGGQKQRTSIARALVKNPPVLILDDPLSAVDAETEEEILRGLAHYYGDRTVLVISHRLSAFRGCDLIVVLHDGKIVEQGSEAELLAMGGRYAEIQREQQLRKEIEKE